MRIRSTQLGPPIKEALRRARRGPSKASGVASPCLGSLCFKAAKSQCAGRRRRVAGGLLAACGPWLGGGRRAAKAPLFWPGGGGGG